MEDWEKNLPAFRVYWILAAGEKEYLNGHLFEDYSTEEQAMAVYEGHGPAPRAWWEVCVLKKSGRLYGQHTEYKTRKRKEAVAELELKASVA